MKIMAFVGSPRKGSNTDTLIDKVIEGAKSVTDVQVEKIYLYKADIKYCTGCGKHNTLQDGTTCSQKDDMAGILDRMQQADAFIFGTPNHCRTISAAMTNFFSRLMPILKMHVERDDSGNIIHAQSRPLIKGKKVVTVISQGDLVPSSSALVFMVLDQNLKDFHLKKVGEVWSAGNLKKAQVKEKPDDLNLAFSTGQTLATVSL